MSSSAAHFIQYATLPIAKGSYDKAMAIFGPFADYVRANVPGCLEFALYKSVDGTTGHVNIIISERYVSAEAHDSFTATPVYADMFKETIGQNVLRAESYLTPVEAQVGGFTNRA